MSFLIYDRMKDLPDVQRSFMWELSIPNIGDIVTTATDTDITIRARTATIPGRGNEIITSEFMGMKQYFAGKPTFEGTFAVQLEEFEDQIIYKTLTEWMNYTYNAVPGSTNAGTSLAANKRSYAKTVYLILYKYGVGETKMSKKIRFVNAFVQNVGPVSLSYANSDSVKYDVTFQYDFWDLQDNTASK